MIWLKLSPDGFPKRAKPDLGLAREELGWQSKWDFAAVLQRLRETGDIRGPLAKEIGAKGYHAERFEGAPYPVAGS